MMVKAVISYVGAAILLTTFGTLPAASDQDAPPEGVVILSNDSSDHEGELQWFECEGEPQLATGWMDDIPGCGDYGGEHVRGYVGYIGFGFRIHETGNAGAIPLTGTLEAHLSWADGASTFRCQWDLGQFVNCNIPNIQRPPPGETFAFRCASTPGAIGHWGDCFLVHS